MRALKFSLLLFAIWAGRTAGQEKKPAERKPDLALTTVGRQHHPIATKNRGAQEFFDQGITLLYGFNHEEAARAFRRASELDPSSPMPLWGIATAVGPNYNMDVDAEREKLAFETIQKAQKLSAHAPQAEKDYVAALALRYSGDASPDYKKLARAFADAMKGLSEKYPDDLDAATLYAESLMNLNPWKLWSSDGKAAPGTDRIVSVLEWVLKRDPNHLGANHFYIYAVEASADPGRALPSAARLDTAAPASGHIVHMPAHIYARTGDQAGSARANASGAAADAKYLAAAPPDSIYGLMYYSHNLSFLADAEMARGRFKDALQPSELLAKMLDGNARA